MHKYLLTLLIFASSCSSTSDVTVYWSYPEDINCRFIGRVTGSGKGEDNAIKEMKVAVVNLGGDALRVDMLSEFDTGTMNWSVSGSAYKCKTS